MTAQILITLNLLIAIIAIPPALYLLRKILQEDPSYPFSIKGFIPINIGLRFIFTLPILISGANTIFALSLIFSLPFSNVHLLELGFVVGLFSCLSTWFFYYVYRKL